MRSGWPMARTGERIGLLGGSFDPAHDGHAHITHEALKRFGLDRVWWLVSPGNPLKPDGPAPMADRLAAARAVIDHPRVCVTDIEADLGTRYTAATLGALTAVYPGVRFTWLMGADNLAQFHRWDRWRWIMSTVPVGVIARPGSRKRALNAKAAQVFARYRLAQGEAHGLGGADAPAWAFVSVPLRGESSSDIRARGDW